MLHHCDNTFRNLLTSLRINCRLIFNIKISPFLEFKKFLIYIILKYLKLYLNYNSSRLFETHNSSSSG